MPAVFVDPPFDDRARRESVFRGDFVLLSRREAARRVAAHAESLIREAFDPLDPETAQDDLPVERFVEIAAGLKSAFTNGTTTKRLIADLLVGLGADPDDTLFDVPRLRVAPYGGYLSSGVSYAYKPHRDTWYASPTAQVNWWSPVLALEPTRAMAFYPSYWGRELPNSSESFDYGYWTSVARDQATSQVGADTRPHPVPTAPVDESSDLRFVTPPGGLLAFSAAHLHATVPNTSDRTRFSFDFRQLCLTDLADGRAAVEVDGAASGSTIGDFLRVADLEPIDARALAALTRS